MMAKTPLCAASDPTSGIHRCLRSFITQLRACLEVLQIKPEQPWEDGRLYFIAQGQGPDSIGVPFGTIQMFHPRYPGVLLKKGYTTSTTHRAEHGLESSQNSVCFSGLLPHFHTWLINYSLLSFLATIVCLLACYQACSIG